MKEEKKESKSCPFGRIAQSIVALVAATTGKGIELEFDPTFIDMCKCGPECGMWLELYPMTQREAHDGGKEMLFKQGFETHREPRQISHNVWQLDASGRCGLINGGKLK